MVVKKLTIETCEKWKKTNRTKNPLTKQKLNNSLKEILLTRCNELLNEPRTSSISPNTLIKAAEKSIFNHKIAPSNSASNSAFKSASKSLSEPSSIEIKKMREKLPFLFTLSFQDFEKMQSDIHRIHTVLLNYDITDPQQVKLVKKFIKYIINIPNAKSKKSRELSEIIQSKKYKKTSFKDLPADIVKKIGKKYYDIMTEDDLHEWIDKNKIDWYYLSDNENPAAIRLLKQYKDKINWENLSENKNPAAIRLFKENQDKIDWSALSGNENPAAIKLLEQHSDKIKWLYLSQNKNPAAIRLFK